jgi:hypothetical protein
MILAFKDLKALDEQDFRETISEVLATRKLQYQDVISEEIFDFLEEASVTYSLVEPALSHQLRDIARTEIEFFLSLYQDSLKKSFFT